MILAVMFLLGVFAALAQVMLMREAMVAFLGNELTIGSSLASWLIGIALGALAARVLLRFLASDEAKRALIALALLFAGILIPFQLYGLRIFRILFDIPIGEYPGLTSILAGSFLLFLPTATVVGVTFPFACALWQQKHGQDAAGTVGRIYSIESLGSMVGGATLTFIMLPHLTTFRIILLLMALPVGAAGIMLRQRLAGLGVCVIALVLAGLAILNTPVATRGERFLGLERGRAFGIVPDKSSGEEAGAKWITELDTVYRNLALSESGGQYVVYSDGQVLFQFPDSIGYEHQIHFVMAQNPGVKRILLFGGNPVGDIPELLKYDLQQLTYVELDPGLETLLGAVVPGEYKKVRTDARVNLVHEDGPRFALRCSDTFDAILVCAPEPSTIGANRYYTTEFYRELRRLLAPGGFVYTAVTSSERLESEAADFGGSIYRSLKEVFPVVLVTAEARNRFFAGSSESGLTFSRIMLASRSESAQVGTKFFRPEYFIGADEIDEDKSARVVARFEAASVSPNTNLKPAACFLNLFLWSRSSGSGMESVFRALSLVSSSGISIVVVAIGFAVLLAGCVVKWRARAGASCCQNAESGWARAMLAAVILTTGLGAMALELVMIFIFQATYGYVYAKIGLIFAAFMLGLALGAPCGRFIARSGRAWLFAALLEVGMVGVVAVVAHFAETAAGTSMFEALFYGIVVLTAWLVGAEYPIANSLYVEAGASVGKAAAITDSADHLGAALGAVAAGVVLVPVLGIAATCVVLMAVQVSGLMFLFSGWLAARSPVRAA